MKLKPGDPSGVQVDPRQIERVRSLAVNFVSSGSTPSLVVFAARKGVILINQAFGVIGPDPGSPALQTDSLFPVKSITKLFTATAAMILVEEGKLSLTRPVSEYIPEFTGSKKESVLVHHLLTHTSGLRDEDIDAQIDLNRDNMEKVVPREDQDPWLHEYLHLSYDTPLRKPPGVEMAYADYNYNLLGEIVQTVCGQSLPEFAKKRIFLPLGMKNTGFGSMGISEDRIVKRPANAFWGPLSDNSLTRMFPSVSGLSTAEDLAIFGQMFLNGGTYGKQRILSPPSAKEMTRNQIPGIPAVFLDEHFPEAGWSLGWSVRGGKNSAAYGEPLMSKDTFVHGGYGGSIIWCDPRYEMVGVSLCVSMMNDEGLPIGINPFLINALLASIADREA